MNSAMSVLSGKQESHPEQSTGEIFLGYMDRERFGKLAWKSKREGQMVYADDGTIVPQGHHHAPEKRLFPVFAERSEVEESRRSA
jgi:hypothetical protein